MYASPRQLRKPVLHKHRRVAYMPFWVGWRYRGDRANRFTVFTLLLPSTVTHSYSPPSLDSMHKTFRTANSCSVRGWVENFDQPTKLTLSRIRTWISYKHTHTHSLSLSVSLSLQPLTLLPERWAWPLLCFQVSLSLWNKTFKAIR